MGCPRPSLNVVVDYFSHFRQKLYKIYIKHSLNITFLDCLTLTFFDVICDLLPKLALLTNQGRTIFRPTSNLADIPVSRERIPIP